MGKKRITMKKRQNNKNVKEKTKSLLVNRNYKDTVFRILYRDDKKRQLELYNSVSGKNYTNANELQVVTLKHALYMGMKNDLAFLVSDDLHLYEHQSTVNPNIPLRFLHYISKEYEGLVGNHKLYGSTPVKIAIPYFLVFYNGTEQYPKRTLLKLSDLYKANNNVSTNISSNSNSNEILNNNVGIILEKEAPFLELKVLVVNINPGQNETFLEQCTTLCEYMKYVSKVRKYNTELGLEQAVNRAVDECIQEGILEDFLRKNKAEVVAMSIFEYDEKK